MMNLFLLITMAWVVPVLPSNAANNGEWQQYATPEQAGFSSPALEEVFAMAEAGATAAMMVIVDGRVLLAWGQVESRYKCHSVRKSIYSALIGMFHDQGKIDLNKTLADLGIDDIHGLSANERKATLRDLISARSGVYHPAAKEPVSMKQRRPKRESHAPGTHFFYNNWDFNTCAIILERETGEELFDAFQARLARPLGMQDYRPRDGFHEFDRSASRYPAHAFRLSARDLARIGQLYLQQGMWNGKRLLSKAWIKESTSPISTMPPMGYGYMWWIGEEKAADGGKRPVYAALGTGGQIILVDDATGIVVVHRGDTDHNRHASERDMFAMYRKILAARTLKKAKNPKLQPMTARPLAGRLAAVEVPTIVTIGQAQLDNKTGSYTMPDGTVVSVRALSDRLIGAHPMLGEVDFFPTSATQFQAYNANIGVEFVKDDYGIFSQVKLNMNGGMVPMTRVME